MARGIHSKKNNISRAQITLREDCALDPCLPVVAGFSGGADSLCMLGLLAELGWQVIAAHFDHHLRPESGLDAERAAELAQRVGVPFVLGGGEVAEYARVEKLSIEDAARKMRYAFLFETAYRLGAQAVCVAHTADDQAETVLMHLIRGSGLAGLKGMQVRTIQTGWNQEIPLIRPLLGLERSETEAWCKSRGFEPVVDPTNADPVYTRNRIRLELLPYLERYNPNIRQTLARTATVLNAEYVVASAGVERVWQELQRGSGTDWVKLNLPGLRVLEDGILYGLFRRTLAQLRPGLAGFDFEDILRAANFARNPGRREQIDLACGLRLFIETDFLCIEVPGTTPLPDRWPQLLQHAAAILPVPGEILLANGWVIRTEKMRITRTPAYSGGEFEAWLDAANTPAPLFIRPAKPGERIQSLGMKGKTQKLSDLWINAHIPRRARASYPVIYSEGAVVWVPGQRMAEPFRISASTGEAIHLTLMKNPA